MVRGYDQESINGGLEVDMLQGRLQAVIGADCVTADGVYGPRTRNAVGEFLQRNGLNGAAEEETGADDAQSSNGTADGATLTPSAAAMLRELHLSKLEEQALQNALDTAPVADQASTTPQPLPLPIPFLCNAHKCRIEPLTIPPRLLSQDLKLLQLALRQLMGRDDLVADGKYGPKTRRAIEEFQVVFGMPSGGDISEQLKIVSGVLRSIHKERNGETQAGQYQEQAGHEMRRQRTLH